jgi:hypothetical protein
MAVTFIASAAGADGIGGRASIAVNKPTGTLDGHLMIAYQYDGSSATAPTLLAGWTSLGTGTSGTTSCRVSYRFASSEGASYTFAFAGTDVGNASIHTFSGVKAGVLDGSISITANTTGVAGSQTVTYDGSILMTIYAGVAGFPGPAPMSFSTPGGMTAGQQANQFITGGNIFINGSKGFYEARNAGSTGTRTSTVSESFGFSISLVLGADVILNQTSFQVYADDAGGLNGSTPLSAEGVTAGALEVGQNFGLRIETANTGTAPATLARVLAYSRNGGAWTYVSTTDTYVRVVASAFYSNRDATTQRLTGTGTFQAGQGMTTTQYSTAVSLAAGYNLEDQWNLQFQAAAIGSSFQFRVWNSNTTGALTTYTVTPTINPINWLPVGDVLYYDSTKFSATPTFYVEGYIKTDNAIRPASFRLYNNTDSAVVASSTTSTTSTSLVRLRSSTVTLTTAKEYAFQLGIAKGGVESYQGGKLIIQQ